MSEVLPATENDLKVILGWLEREYEEDEEGFWSNRCMITRSFLRWSQEIGQLVKVYSTG